MSTDQNQRPNPAPVRGRRTALVALVLVVLAGGCLWIAGHGPVSRTGEAATRSVGTASTVAARALTCAADLPGSTRVSRIGAGEARSEPITAAATLDVPAHPTGADDTAYAAQVASGAKWLAYADCPQPRDTWWFVGAGAGATHDSTLTLVNPRPGDAVVDVDVYGPHGRVGAPGLHGLPVVSGAKRVLDLAKMAPATGELAVRVTASRGLVVASLAEQNATSLVNKAVSAWVPASLSPARSVVVTGLPVKPVAATLLVANPASVDAVVTVRAIGAGGTFGPKGAGTLTVPASSVGTLNVGRAFDGKPTAFLLTSRTSIGAAVRAGVGIDEAYGAAATPLRGSVAAGVPRGVSATVLLSSTGKAGSARVRAYDAKGKQIAHREVEVAAATSVGRALPAGTRSIVVSAGTGDVVAGLTLTGSPGVAGLALAPVEQNERIPGVVPAAG